jgi:DNA-binding NtrC family response regulator
MRRIYALLEQLAGVELPVLIGGETGSGKELAALALHQLVAPGGAPVRGAHRQAGGASPLDCRR